MLALRFNDDTPNWYDRRFDLHLTGKIEIVSDGHDIWVQGGLSLFNIPHEQVTSLHTI